MLYGLELLSDQKCSSNYFLMPMPGNSVQEEKKKILFGVV